jgi:broad specificity phosphatase PhoE
MTTKLFLIRHGETHANIEQRYQGQGNSHLSELGLKEAEELSNALKGQQFSAVYSSDLIRSFDTACAIAKPHKLEPTKLPGLKERFYGEWEGLTFEEIKKKYPAVYSSWLVDPAKTVIPGAETLDVLQERGVRVIEQLVKKHDEQTICVVGHGGINRAILFHYMVLDLNNFWRIKQDNCCINIIEFGSIPSVMLLNSTWFLGEKRMRQTGYY